MQRDRKAPVVKIHGGHWCIGILFSQAEQGEDAVEEADQHARETGVVLTAVFAVSALLGLLAVSG